MISATAGGVGGTGDNTDGSGGSGGTGFAFGSGGSGASDPATEGIGGNGGGAGSFNANGGGGGFGQVGGAGTSIDGAITGSSQLVPFTGGSGGGGGGGITSGGGGGGGAGGALIIYATGTITIDGVVSADGGNGAVGTSGDGGGGSGGSVVLQASQVTTSSATWDADGGTGTSAGGDGRIRVDGVPSGGASILGTISDAPTEFVGPSITSVTTSQVIGTAAANATVDVHLSNGVTTSTTSDTADANGDFTVNVTYLTGANYITVTQDTGSNVVVMSPAALGILSVNITGTTDLADSTLIRCAQNGGLLPQTGTVSGGAFTITGVSKPDTDDIVTCWADGVAEADESTAVTKYDGEGNISGLVLNRHKLTVGSDENQAVTVTNLGQYDQDDDEDIIHTSNSSILSLDPGSAYTDEELVLQFSNSVTIGTAETLTTHDLDIDGTLTLVGNAMVTVSGDWDATGAGTWSEGTSQVTLNGSDDQTIFSDGENFYGLTINNTGAGGSDDVVLVGTLDVDQDITITDGDLDQSTNSVIIEVFGDWTTGGAGSLDEGTSTIIFNGTSTNQSISSNDDPFYDVVMNNTATAPDDRLIISGTLDINGDLNITEGRLDIDANAGNIEAAGDFIIGASGGLLAGNTTETIMFDGVNDQTITTNSQSILNLIVNNNGTDGSDDSLIVTDNLDIDGDLRIIDGDIDANTNDVNITLAGDWTIEVGGTFDAGVGMETVTFDGGDQTITGSTNFNNLTKIETSNNSTNTNFYYSSRNNSNN